MIPILYGNTETEFTSEGIGRLTDAISCIVVEQRNGEYELAMKYPMTGRLFSELAYNRFIKAKPFDGGDPQPFEIYKISKPINGIVTVYARHISYRLTNIPVMPFNANSSLAVLQGFQTYSAETNPFTFWTDIDVAGSYVTYVPASIRYRLGGTDASFLGIFGGEIEWDKWAVKIHNHRGSNNGVEIAYGKNLIDLTQEESIENTITGICPYWRGEGATVTLPEKVIHSDSSQNFPYERTVAVDFSNFFDSAPTVEDLRTLATAYVESMELGVPEVSLTIDFVPLWQTEDYKRFAPLERVGLCDTVTVRFEKLGVAATAQVVETRYDVFLEKYTLLKIGNVKSGISDMVADQAIQIKAVEDDTKTAFEKALDHATELITGGLGGNVVINTDEGGRPYEILIMDTDSILTAQYVLRMNMNGIAFSKNGYNGDFTSAWTIDGEFLANNVTVSGLTADVISSGNFDSANFDENNPTQGFRLNLNTGEIICPQLQITVGNVGGLENALNELDGEIDTKGNQIGALDGRVAATERVTNDVRTYFRFKDDGLHVGKDGDEYETLTASDKFAILHNEEEVAKFSSTGLDTSRATLSEGLVLEPLQMTAYDNGWIITKV